MHDVQQLMPDIVQLMQDAVQPIQDLQRSIQEVVQLSQKELCGECMKGIPGRSNAHPMRLSIRRPQSRARVWVWRDACHHGATLAVFSG